MEPPNPRGGPQHAVFVDDTGRRARRAQRLYRTVAVLCLGALTLLVVSLLNGVPLPGLTQPVPLPSNEPAHARGVVAAPPGAGPRAARRGDPSPVAAVHGGSDANVAATPHPLSRRTSASPGHTSASAVAVATRARRTTPAPAASSPAPGRRTTPAPAVSPGSPTPGRHTTPPAAASTPAGGRRTTPPTARQTTPATGRKTTPAAAPTARPTNGRHTTPAAPAARSTAPRLL